MALQASAVEDASTVSRKEIPVVNPATGEEIDRVAVYSKARIEAAVLDARAAFRTWRTLSFAERAEILLKGRDRVLEQQERIIELLIEETGKVHADAFTELLSFCGAVGYYAKHGEKFLADERISVQLLKNKRVKSTWMPRGLVVNIAPWNFPLDLAMSEAVPALLAGNAVIIKPSEVTPRIAIKFLEVLREAGLPKGVLQVVPGYGDAGAELVKYADFVCFTGSVATGRKVAVAAAERLVPCTLELGGKDPFIVLEDAHLERAAQGAVWGAFMNCGQVCMSVERVYVVDAVHDAFVDRVVELTRKLRQGIDSDWNTDIGSMIDPRQIDVVDDHVQDAIHKGAQVRTGGRRNPAFAGSFYEPTVLTNIDESMKIIREETFGPVLPIRRVKDGEEALALANDSPYGLNASVWTMNKSRADSIARELESGAVCINDCIVSYAVTEAPFGGVKHSGIGRRKGPGGIQKYCHQKTILEDILGLKREPTWYPYSAKSSRAIAHLLRVLYHRSLGTKLKAARKMFGR